MSNVSKCFSCVHKNDYDPKFGYYGCKLSGQECKGYSMFEPKGKPKPMTNGDRIRRMTDEELADFITDDMCGLICGAPLVCEGQCKQKMLDWLKEEEKG